MKKLILLLVLPASIQAQGVINLQGAGVPTDMAVAGLLGALIAPMVSKGGDAKLVGGVLGALAGGAIQTMIVQQQQQQQQQQYASTSSSQYVNTQNIQTASGGGAEVSAPSRMGIRKGKMVQSPWSRFQFDPESMRMQSGEIVFDPICGKPIQIP